MRRIRLLCEGFRYLYMKIDHVEDFFWSPDSRKLTFKARDNNGNHDIYIHNLDKDRKAQYSKLDQKLKFAAEQTSKLQESTSQLNIALSVFIISSLIALILIQLQKKTNLPGDALLGLLAHSSLAVGLVVIGFLTFIRFDIMGLLFGDILAVTVNDILIIWIGGAFILLILKLVETTIHQILTIFLKFFAF